MLAQALKHFIATRLRVLGVVLFCFAVVGVAPGCKKQESSSPATPTIQKDSYTVRGLVVQLPDPASPAADFSVRHEAIPNFRQQDGNLGMDVMDMPFPLAPGLDISTLKIGDKVELTFEVDLNLAESKFLGYRATKVVVLPPETELDFTPLK